MLAKTASKHPQKRTPSAERAGRKPIQQYYPPRKVPQGKARRAPDANASPFPEQTANVVYAPSMPLTGDGDDIVTSAPYTPTREGKVLRDGLAVLRQTPHILSHQLSFRLVGRLALRDLDRDVSNCIYWAVCLRELR